LLPPDAPPPPRPTRPSDVPIFDAKKYEHELGEAHRPATDDAASVDAVQPAPDDQAPDPLEHDVQPTAVVTTTEVETETTDKDTGEPADVRAQHPEESTVADIGQMAEVVNLSDRRRKKELTNGPHISAEISAPDHPVFERVEGTVETESSAASDTVSGDTVSTTNHVDEIFARLRAASTTRVADAAKKDLATPQNPNTVDESVLRRRTEVLTPALDALMRAMKRHLVDDENTVLTHVGGKRTSLTLAAMLPTAVEQAAQYLNTIRELVTSIAVDAARSHTDARRSDMRSAITQGAVLEKISEMLVSDLIQPLHERVDAAITAAGGDRDALLVALRAIFHEWKSQQLAPVVSDIAYFAYARGLFLGCDTNTTMCWAVDPDGPPCADAEDNSLAGGVRRGDAFPTGHAYPLAHAGCRCLVVPLNK